MESVLRINSRQWNLALSKEYYKLLFLKVARDRIELPTRGFSVPCSTD